jgi:hypothetical protein
MPEYQEGRRIDWFELLSESFEMPIIEDNLMVCRPSGLLMPYQSARGRMLKKIIWMIANIVRNTGNWKYILLVLASGLLSKWSEGQRMEETEVAYWRSHHGTLIVLHWKISQNSLLRRFNKNYRFQIIQICFIIDDWISKLKVRTCSLFLSKLNKLEITFIVFRDRAV